MGHPLTNLQIRSLDTIADAYALFADVAKRVDRLQRAMVDVQPMVKYCANVLEGSVWVDVDYQGAFLAIEGPIFKLKKIDDQTFIQAYWHTGRAPESKSLKTSRAQWSRAN